MYIIIIPAYKPNHNLIDIVEHLHRLHIENIVVVNDGSPDTFTPMFETLKTRHVIVVSHPQNLGKGAAIKTGITYASHAFKDIQAFITCDADGQHLAKDVESLIEASKKNPLNIILGVRDYKHQHMPFRSLLGNRFSSLYFYFATKVHCPDTQTGLRAIPFYLTEEALSIEENRYDYEMAFLLKMAKNKILLTFIPIETVYEKHNPSSHFRPIVDSIRIYKQPLKFSFVSLSSALIDLGIFASIIFLLGNKFVLSIAIATITARIISGIYNFFLNRIFSFQSYENIKHQFIKYGILYISQLAASILLVSGLSLVLQYATTSKIIVDSVLFIISYFIQKHWVYKKK